MPPVLSHCLINSELWNSLWVSQNSWSLDSGEIILSLQYKSSDLIIMGYLKRECSFEHPGRERANRRELSRGFIVKNLYILCVWVPKETELGTSQHHHGRSITPSLSASPVPQCLKFLLWRLCLWLGHRLQSFQVKCEWVAHGENTIIHLCSGGELVLLWLTCPCPY